MIGATALARPSDRRRLSKVAGDRWLIVAAGAMGLLVVLCCEAVRRSFPAPWAAPLIAAVVCWTSNTVAHCHLHRPLFKRRIQRQLFSAYLTATTGIPQSLWRARHLAHHAGDSGRVKVRTSLLAVDIVALPRLARQTAPRPRVGRE